MNNPYCPKHEWPAGMGQRCPDCIEIEFLKAEIMKNRTERDAALLQNRELQQLFSEVATMFELTTRQDIDGLLRGRIQEALAGHESCAHANIEAVGEGFRRCKDCGTMEPRYALKPKSDCTCLFLLNGIHANGCPKCTGKPGVIPVDVEKSVGLARICTCTGHGHTDECELAHKRFCECGHQLSVHVDGRCNGVVQAERDEPCLCEKRV